MGVACDSVLLAGDTVTCKPESPNLFSGRPSVLQFWKLIGAACDSVLLVGDAVKPESSVLGLSGYFCCCSNLFFFSLYRFLLFRRVSILLGFLLIYISNIILLATILPIRVNL